MPSCRATASAVVRLSPVSMTTSMPSARSAAQRLRRRRLDRIGDREQRRRAWPSTATKIDGRAVARAAARPLSRSAAVSTPSSAEIAGVAERDASCPSTLPVDALAGRRSRTRSTAASVELALLGSARRSPAPADARWRARRWRRAAAARLSSNAVGGDDRDDLRLALGQRAGLVDHERVDLLHPLQRFGVLDQHAGLRAAADADHDRHRRGEAERAGAGDDQHGDGGDQPVGQAAARARTVAQAAKASTATSDHGRHEPAGDLVGQPLDRRAQRCASRHHLHDLRQQRVAADLARRA